jgi:hypothetical protein
MRMRQAVLDIDFKPLSVMCHQEGRSSRASGEEQLRSIQLMTSNRAAFQQQVDRMQRFFAFSYCSPSQ